MKFFLASNPVKNECVRFVNSYLDELVNLIVSEYTPEEICVAIRETPYTYKTCSIVIKKNHALSG